MYVVGEVILPSERPGGPPAVMSSNLKTPIPDRVTVDISSHPELEWRETVQGKKPGNRYVRITHKAFRRTQPGYLVPREGLDEPKSRVGRALAGVKRTLIGEPIPTVREAHERLTKVKALAVFSSDALSSV